MSAPSNTTILKDHLADLGMPGSLEAVDGLLERLDSGAISATAMVRLPDAQIALRRERRLIAAMRSSRLPALKTLESFGLRLPALHRPQPGPEPARTGLRREEGERNLSRPGRRRQDPSRRLLPIAAAERGRRVYYGTLSDIVLSLVEAECQGRLRDRMRALRGPSLLIVDEIGYLLLTPSGANLFFQLVNAHHEKASTVLTSNKSFREWGEVLETRSPEPPCSTASSTTATSSISRATRTGSTSTQTWLCQLPRIHPGGGREDRARTGRSKPEQWTGYPGQVRHFHRQK